MDPQILQSLTGLSSPSCFVDCGAFLDGSEQFEVERTRAVRQQTHGGRKIAVLIQMWMPGGRVLALRSHQLVSIRAAS